MPYTGDVTPGGPADVREFPGMTIRKVSVGSMDNNCYLLTVPGGESLLVDAADDPARLLALADDAGARITTVVTTHRHHDHVRALARVVSATGATTYAGEADAAALPAPTDRPLAHGDTVRLGDARLDIIGLRGHTPGGIALAWTDPEGRAHLFVGDSLFPGGPGKTSSPTDFASLMDDLEARVFDRFGDDAWVYPGHGADTTLGAERPHLGEWRERGW